jgi:hypothetical protein
VLRFFAEPSGEEGEQRYESMNAVPVFVPGFSANQGTKTVHEDARR